ncbi:virulence factor [Staphylococcus aureus]|uniref:virulence factor n=1 Tax=Staphylococcus aureus TaxID=1280 RepID=UPI0007CA0E71|nr:virulence factor [Staphylococcus aureus]SAZ48326.1 PBS lyase HEAT-like repeat domain protein [Staphylococcus aureus]HEK4465287.1 virulence factor [Staphylococcus aureus]HEK4467771.1 virulence factor [Staphylococcus aureus]
MEILRIEPTPSPNTMKVVLSYTREDKLSNTYKKVEETQPRFINQLLSIDGITSIFHVMNFLAVDKAPKADWEVILPDIKAAFSDANKVLESVNEPQIDNHFGEIKAELLTFKGIPYQIKLTSADQELREQLPQTYLVKHALEENHATNNYHFYRHVSLDEYHATDNWKTRLRMLNHFPKPTFEDIPLLDLALSDEKVPVRRQAIVLLGMIESKEILPYLYKGLRDKSPAVRRTAGDCISDLGYPEALPEMVLLLDDPQKIVRWRAAMFIFDEGNAEQLPALKAHINDNAFEVKLQIEMAISRIENGDEALGSVWKQMANRTI